ncbi:hypothetical protein H112_00293 [Trichophyton rubrum D6]|uniref:Uncharacterized protein n=4 Tax=Trichophyton TaxID=5550 RepID=A0A178EYS9_TRIRU|nr:uncharacterized protein TERG_08433 [Trichophyton rubrum CBS 118892]EZF27818.1 hypothetical protein H100_00294 [Trichophyton rubrum MR850]EZF46792.1 hypothetical protein H102_00293 [Trichophyton rubrum CBS 100081]EZF57451.1 hypothetical protein H103_00292 [Trichophyton rubrum CBS 288.86]EZF68057.1 hypothetical protein H104_00292 [Trichophyton rubrum CBS 289.86]EZF78719.1 hypothetical protein H105_00287 [Trichophyton soudanense CBS 452.61]EZF89408.1 hypothetical protein H110_00296 [Trichophy
MGNICSKSSNRPDPFAQPGRVLGSQAASTKPTPANSSTPLIRNNNSSQRQPSGGRVLGGGGNNADGDGDARSAAARAAEERAAKHSAAGKGKLSSQLAAQKSRSRNDTLDDISRAERAARDAQSAEESRRWD